MTPKQATETTPEPHVVINLIFQDASDGHVGFMQIIQVVQTYFSGNLLS